MITNHVAPPTRGRDAGFTLIELIVVMVIIGILAAVALPVYQNQQRQAVDTATKSDLNAFSKVVASYWVENSAPPCWNYSPQLPPLAELMYGGTQNVRYSKASVYDFLQQR